MRLFFFIALLNLSGYIICFSLSSNTIKTILFSTTNTADYDRQCKSKWEIQTACIGFRF